VLVGTAVCAKTPGPTAAHARNARVRLPGSGAVRPAYAVLGPVNTASTTPVIVSLSPGGFHLPAKCLRLTARLDIRAIWAYYKNIAPDIWQLHPEI
jgi:hypothetical protein